MVEFSAGYKDNARKKQEAIEQSMTPQARAVARGLFGHFEKSSTKTTSAAPKPPENEAA